VKISPVPRRALIFALRHLIGTMEYVSPRWYTRTYAWFLKWVGHTVTGMPAFISRGAVFDRTDPSLITFGNGVAISTGVHILTHDFSVACIDKALGNSYARPGDDVEPGPASPVQRRKVAPVFIGDNVFIGAHSIVLPGAIIGRDCIIGAGTVVRGRIPDGSMVIGNPGQIIRSIYDRKSAMS
jgi:acetyltransferase-like isoleucine patch superfamily enzyme